MQIFTTLREDGVLKKTVRNCDIAAMVYIIVLSTATWLQGNAPYQNELLPNFSVSQTLSHMVYGNISEDYQEEFRKLRKEKKLDMEENGIP